MKIKELFPNKTRYYTPITVLYFLVIIIFTFFFHLPMKNHMGNFLSGIHAIFMMIAISPRVKLKYKYILAILAMISLYLSMRLFPIDLNILHFMIFYIPFLYAYLLPDIISPLLVGIIFSRIFLVYEGQSSNGEIIGSIIGLYSSAIVHSIISLLVARLYDMKETYRNLSIRDSLTGLYNLDYIIRKGEEFFKNNIPFAIVVFDIDHFKSFNDTFGHVSGNYVLVEIGELLKRKTKLLGGFAGRIGGDEFIALLPNIEIEEANFLYKKAQSYLKGIYLPIERELDPIKVSISVGMKHTDSINEKTLDSLIKSADKKMYYNKHTRFYNMETFRLEEILNEGEKGLLRLLSEKDMYSYVHSKYVVLYTKWILEELNVKEKTIIEILRGAWLHDIGKLFISNDILRKYGKLTDYEYEIVKHHVNIGMSIVKDFNLSKEALNAIEFHHERWDGKGYPKGIKGVETPVEGRIIQIADSYSAMTVKRVYRKTFDIEEAKEELIKNKYTQYDPILVDIFVEIMDRKIKDKV